MFGRRRLRELGLYFAEICKNCVLWNSKEFGVWVRRGQVDLHLGTDLASAACMRDEAGVSRAIGDAKSVG